MVRVIILSGVSILHAAAGVPLPQRTNARTFLFTLYCGGTETFRVNLESLNTISTLLSIPRGPQYLETQDILFYTFQHDIFMDIGIALARQRVLTYLHRLNACKVP